jgi:hypothetical protein
MKSEKSKCPICGSHKIVESGSLNFNGADDAAITCIKCGFQCCFVDLKSQVILKILLNRAGIFEGK